MHIIEQYTNALFTQDNNVRDCLFSGIINSLGLGHYKQSWHNAPYCGELERNAFLTMFTHIYHNIESVDKSDILRIVVLCSRLDINVNIADITNLHLLRLLYNFNFRVNANVGKVPPATWCDSKSVLDKDIYKVRHLLREVVVLLDSQLKGTYKIKGVLENYSNDFKTTLVIISHYILALVISNVTKNKTLLEITAHTHSKNMIDINTKLNKYNTNTIKFINQ